MTAAVRFMTPTITRRILVIDDEANIRTIVTTCLYRLGGWDTVSASSGYEALQIIQTEQVDAIVLDMMMPGMDGVTFLSHLRSDPLTAKIPVVVLSANSDFTQARASVRLGVSAAIAKPFNPALLANQVGNALGWDMK